MGAPSLERVEVSPLGRPALVWRLPTATNTVATTVLGGGLGVRTWMVSAQVDHDFHHPDPAAHVSELAHGLELPAGEGVGFLTAASVLDVTSYDEDGARCDATVGISVPTWAAAPGADGRAWRAGTINLVCWVPASMSDAALVNLLVTATEAKAQALFEAGVPGTGTASDAVAVCCPPGGDERYGGPRSKWGARLARAVHGAVTAGLPARREAPQ